MEKLIIAFLFFTCFQIGQHPKEIVGKWSVEYVDISNFKVKMTQQQRELVNKSLVKPLTNAIFDFKPDHHFSLSAELGNMPKDDYWEYDEATGKIKITEFKDRTSRLMEIEVVEKSNQVFFILQETSVVLKMHKKES